MLVDMTFHIPEYEGNTQIGTRSDESYPTARDGYHYFTVYGLNAAQMNDVVEGRLHLERDGKAYSITDRYSIAQYALTQLNKEGLSSAFRTLCADLLRYGATTQIYKGYRTDALADQALTAEQRSYLTDLGSVSFGPKSEIRLFTIVSKGV